MNKQLLLDVHNKLIVDLFAGGGGMSVAFENAFGRSPDIAINHNDDALSMHRMNHPLTRHFIADVYEVDPHGATQGREVGWLHLSPDCTHHSQAASGQPRSEKIRGLSWVGYRWGGQVHPDVISLENVKQILKWGPLIAKRDKVTGRVVTLEMIEDPVTGKKVNRVADKGERVPVQQQYLVPDPKREGQTWRKFVTELEKLGYKVEWRNLVAADFGGHTTRERLFMIARRDGLPITWPEPTHFKKPAKGQKKWKSAAECIDFSDLGKTIFDRKKALAEATMRRIAKGVKRYVLDNARPFIVPIAHYNGRDSAHSIDEPLRTITSATKGGEFALATPVLSVFRGESQGRSVESPLPTVTSGGNSVRDAGAAHALGNQGHDRVHPVEEPMRTITAAHRGETMLASPVLVHAGHGEGNGDTKRRSHGIKDIQEPLVTVVASGGGHAVATAYMMQANDGFNTNPGRDLDEPMSTITNTGSQQQLVTAHLAHLRGNCDARDLDEPLMTVSAGGQHHATVAAFLSRQFGNSVGHAADEPLGTTTAGGGGKSALVECVLSPEDEAGALRVAAFLMEYYSEGGQWSELDKPLNTITTKDRLALVTVFIQGTPYVIVDIRLRMLKPRELFNGQDFPPSYIIDRGHDGRKFSISAQVRMCGNSVDPIMATAFLASNAPWLSVKKAA
jgi:DNA (cytosine-5)-methyltransferase 1